MQPRIVLMALYDNSHGRYILQGLIDAGMIPSAVFLGSMRSTIRYRYRSIIRYFRKNGGSETISRIMYRAFKRKDVLQVPGGGLPPALYKQAQQYNIPLIRFNSINDAQAVQALSDYQPDFLVLGGAPLLKRNVLSVPRYGVVNAHPAKLPQVRGMDVVGWSIIESVPIGLTVFFVDEGIDTGSILYFHQLRDISGLNLEQIELKLQSQAGKATAKALQGFLSGDFSPIKQRKEDGKLYKAMPRITRLKVNHLLQHC